MRLIIVYAVAAVFMLAGLWLMVENITTTSYYKNGIADAQQMLEDSDPANADGPEAELAALEAENQVLEQTRDDLQLQIHELEVSNEALLAEYDAIDDSEDTIYYRTILESLQEGLKRVEEYISGNP